MLENKEIYQMVKPVIQDGVYAAAYIHFALQNQARVQSSELSRLLRPLAHQLLLSDSLSAVNLALDAAGRLNIGNLRKTVIAVIKQEQLPDKTLLLPLTVLENELEANIAILPQQSQKYKPSF